MRKLTLALSALAAMTFGSASAQTTYQYATSATQGGPLPLLLDFYPGGRTCTAPRPTVMYIHGGGFRSGSRSAAQNKGLAQAFPAAGINLVSITYRLHGDGPLPSQPYLNMLNQGGGSALQGNYEGQVIAALAAFEDANKALQYVVANAARDCVNTREIYLAGSSAGAVTALNLAYSMDEAGIRRPSIEGVIDLWGGGMPADAIDRGSVPLFIAHGERDTTTPFAFAEAYWQRANAVGVPIQLHAFARTGHGFDLRRKRVDGTPVLALAVQFVLDIANGRGVETVRTRN